MTEPSLSTRSARNSRQSLRAFWPKPFCLWIDRLAAISSDPDALFLLGGCLATLDNSLKKRYARSGAEVQQLIFALHGLLGATSGGDTQTLLEIKDHLPWIRTQLNSDDSNTFKKIMIGWIDIASERLTMRSYPRADTRARHARIMISRPLLYLLREEIEQGDEADSVVSQFDRFADLLILFCDLLRAEQDLELGRNLIEDVPPNDMRGFYALHGDVATLDETEMYRQLDRLAERLHQLESPHLPDPYASLFKEIASEMIEAIAHRKANKQWPEAFRSPQESGRGDTNGWWATLCKKIFS